MITVTPTMVTPMNIHTRMLGQMKREVTQKQVRYVINTHFRWDHTQGHRQRSHPGSDGAAFGGQDEGFGGIGTETDRR
jgi:glyoxylase-like metal-dependent hydrolase (beta-lactamase superfamily II)